MRQDRWVLAFVFVISFLLFYNFRAPFLGQWDSFDYMWQIICHKPCTLAFGRPYYIGYNVLVWQLAKSLWDLAVDQACQVVQITTVLLGSLTLLVYFGFVRRLVNRPVAWISTLLLLGSPLYIVYSGYIMTEIPMLFFLLSGLWVYLRGLDENKKYLLALGAGLVGVSIGVREQALFFLPLLMMLPFIRQANRAGKGITVLALTLFPAIMVGALGSLGLLLWNRKDFLYSVTYWFSKVPRRAIDLQSMKVALLYVFINSPIATIVSIPGLISLLGRKKERVPPNQTPHPQFAIRNPQSAIRNYNPPTPELLAFFFFAVILPLLLLLPDGDLKLHPRYELSLVPGLAILAAVIINQVFDRLGARALWKYGLVAAGSALLIVGAAPYINDQRVRQQDRRALSEYLLQRAPANAAFIPGTYTPVINYYRQIGMRPDWQMVDSGWDWSEARLLTLVNKFIEEGREICVIRDRHAWGTLEDELADLKRLSDRFDFVRLDDRLQKLQLKRSDDY